MLSDKIKIFKIDFLEGLIVATMLIDRSMPEYRATVKYHYFFGNDTEDMDEFFSSEDCKKLVKQMRKYCDKNSIQLYSY
jgi:hypothetical protein